MPLVDLKAAHQEVADEVRAGFESVLANTAFVGGDEVRRFEREYAGFGGVAHCVGVANGTDAVELALRASGVGTGDEVVLPANTFIATAGAVARIGARPVLADCLPDSHLLDPRAALAAVTFRSLLITSLPSAGSPAIARTLGTIEQLSRGRLITLGGGQLLSERWCGGGSHGVPLVNV